MKVFVDLDGVVAGFDEHYERLFGVNPKRHPEPPDFWERIAQHKTFYRDLPVMADALDLWDGVLRFDRHPTVLTGVPSSLPDAAAQKRAWVAEHLGPHVKVITCRSRDKCLHGTAGDVLIDDWKKYRKYWVRMGGVFILHTSAAVSLIELDQAFESQYDY